jgi:hypothetical protein
LHALDSSHHGSAPFGERVEPRPGCAPLDETRRDVGRAVRARRARLLNEPARRKRLSAAESTGEVLRMDVPRL